MELQQGLFRIDPKTYHKMPGLSYTGIKEFLRSPAHYKAFIEGEHNETPAMKFGSAYHAYVLENNVFHESYVVAPDLDKRSKQYKEWEEQNAGRESIHPRDLEKIQKMASVLWSHPQWKTFAPGSEREIAMVWHDHALDIWCRTRIDLLQPALRVPLDLKTTVDARPSAFLSKAFYFGYHLQASWTLRGLKAITGLDHNTFVFIAQEKEDPYAIKVYEAQPPFIQQGDREIASMLNDYAECLKTGVWPCYAESMEGLYPPTWAEMPKLQEDDDESFEQATNRVEGTEESV